MDEAASPDVRPLLTATLAMIRERLGNLVLRHPHLVPDFVVYCYATDVLEHCGGTLPLVDSHVPPAAYACARAALEAARGLLLPSREPSHIRQTRPRGYRLER